MEHSSIYTPDVIARLELGWGPGWLSPGGLSDVAQLVAGISLAGRSVLDIGTGAGGPALALVNRFGAWHVTGIDVEQSVLDRAKILAEAELLEKRIDFRRVAAGPLPFPDAHFDVVFSKDAFVHIADKALLFAEMFRVLKPGGHCVFSDWCCGPPPYSVEMQQFLNNGMNFTMATLQENCSYLENAGFKGIASKDRNGWFAMIAAQEVETVSNADWAHLASTLGPEAAESVVDASRRRAIIARQGHLRPAHFRATKPDD